MSNVTQSGDINKEKFHEELAKEASSRFDPSWYDVNEDSKSNMINATHAGTKAEYQSCEKQEAMTQIIKK